MSGTSIVEELRQTEHGSNETNGRALILVGSGTPSNTADVGWMYIDVTAGTNSTARMYYWNDAGSAWVVQSTA